MLMERYRSLKVSEVNVEVDADLQRIGALGELACTAGSAALHGEGVVLRVGEVASPHAHDDGTEVVVGMGAEQGIELLTVGVCLVPPRFALSRDVGAQRQFVDMPVGHRAERMLRNEGDVVVCVVIVQASTVIRSQIFLRICILVELRIGEAVGKTPVEGVVESLASQSGLKSAGVALASIHHDTAVIAVRLHDGELLVAYLHVEEGEVEVQAVVEKVQVRA